MSLFRKVKMSPWERDKKVDELQIMSQKEITRIEVMQALKDKRINQRQASEQLGVSVRQIKRIWKRYQEKGGAGLAHQRRGRPSNNQIDSAVLQHARDLIVERYRDFGPTLACEKLVEQHGIKISVERLRQLMVSEGIWKARRRKNKRVFQMRERRPCVGDLVQIDGSDYDWFEGRSPRCTLLVFVDDASGMLMELRFVAHESFFAYCEAVRSYFERWGKPRAFYSDKHGIFHLNHPKALQGDGLTEFGRAMQHLGIQIICANTPQAKGRVERANKTLQDRLTKELRLRGIHDPLQANLFLPEFMADYNRRFAVLPRSSVNAHQTVAASEDLDRILVRQETRVLSKALTLQYHKVIYQIQTTRPAYALRNARVLVCEDSQGHIQILYKNQPLEYTVFHRQQRQAEVVPAKSINHELCKPHIPAPDHPWRKGFKTPRPKQNPHLSQWDILTLDN